MSREFTPALLISGVSVLERFAFEEFERPEPGFIYRLLRRGVCGAIVGELKVRSFLRALFITFCALSCIDLSSQPPAIQSNRLFHGETIFPVEGFEVTERFQSPVFGITAGIVPGAMPAPVRLRIDGAAKTWAWEGYSWIPSPETGAERPGQEGINARPPPSAGAWYLEGQEYFRPVYGTIHFGYSDSVRTVLEDGSALDGLVELKSVTNENLALFGVFGLSEAPAARIKLSGDSKYAVWEASLAELGGWKAEIEGLVGAAAQLTANAECKYKVVIDRYKARVFVYFTELKVYVPLMWRDRYNGKVTFRWERESNPLKNIERICLTISNEQGKGAKLQWINYQDGESAERDLVRVDFIGINAPSMHIKGYPGICPELPQGLTRTLTPNALNGIGQIKVLRPATGGPVNRPTRVILSANRNELPYWNGGWAIPPQTYGEKSIARQWDIAYSGAHKNLVSSYKDPKGLRTDFTYSQSGNSIPYPFGQTYSGDKAYGNIHPIKHAYLTKAVTSDTTGAAGGDTAVQAWSYGANQLVAQTSAFNGITKTIRTYYDAPKARDRANSVWKRKETLEGATLIASIDNLETGAAGLDNTCTTILEQRFTKKDEPPFTVKTQTGVNGLRINNIEIRDAAHSPRLVQVTEQTYASADILDPGSPASKKTTNYGINGAVLGSTPTQRNVWSGIFLIADRVEAGGKALGTQYAYDSASGRLVSSKPCCTSGGQTTYGAKKTMEYAPNGQVNKITASDSANAHIYTIQTTRFDESSRPAETTDQLGVVTGTWYDDRGRITRQTRAGITTEYSYPTELKSITTMSAQGDASRITVTEESDPFGRIVSRKTAAQSSAMGGVDTTQASYAYSGGTITVTTNRNGVTTVRVQKTDGLGRPVYTKAEDGAETTYQYEYDYSVSYRPSLTSPAPVETVTETGSANTYKVTTKVKKGTNTLTTIETKNILGQVLEVQGPQAGTVQKYVYDGAGNVTEHRTITPQGEQVRAYTYDEFGRLTSRTEPETGVTAFKDHDLYGQPRTVEETLTSHDAGLLSQGRLVTRRIRSVVYDEFGRCLSVSAATTTGGGAPADSGDKLTYAYQTTKPLLRQSVREQRGGPDIAQDYAYGEYGRVAEEKTIGQDGFIARIKYAYDAWGRVKQVTYPGAATNTDGRTIYYQNDVYGKVITVKNNSPSAQNLVRIAYDESGEKSETLFASGARNKYTRGNNTNGGTTDQIVKWEVTPNGAETITKQFAYDGMGYITSTGDWQITNDYLGRVRTAIGFGVLTQHGHDGFGNNVAHSAIPGPNIPPGAMLNWELPPLPDNRVPPETTSGANTWWDYRQNGEAALVGKAAGGDYIQLAWDGLGLLKAVSDNGNIHNFTYSPSGLRLTDKRTGVTPRSRRFVYTTGGMLLTVYELSTANSGQISARRDIVHANGEAIAEIDQSGNVYELHNDYLGSPRYITSGVTGQIVGEQAFGPYGERMEGAGLSSGYRPLTGYTGHIEEDLTGLIYMKGRYYSPGWHRFISSDQGVDPFSLNQFVYVNGRPFMATDPSGMAIGETGGRARIQIETQYATLLALEREMVAWINGMEQVFKAMTARVEQEQAKRKQSIIQAYNDLIKDLGKGAIVLIKVSRPKGKSILGLFHFGIVRLKHIENIIVESFANAYVSSDQPISMFNWINKSDITKEGDLATILTSAGYKLIEATYAPKGATGKKVRGLINEWNNDFNDKEVPYWPFASSAEGIPNIANCMAVADDQWGFLIRNGFGLLPPGVTMPGVFFGGWW